LIGDVIVRVSDLQPRGGELDPGRALPN